ncbi:MULTISPECIES: hypothetical protein [Kocuria]|jgi:hypothetical protein|uniref:hypothetical protein n=1 Tax=Kocuria TaxID=57493 RepID=UPI00037CB4D1|nr:MULTISPECIES: hypothetical protein [Kocuria]EYT51323.1 hypothetical protein H488_0112750 [Kocuria sp. UCD-OTCP]MEB2527837.1 hypothetical protein [Kocuria rosea]MEB2617713.1 hypothetical protein [Kocuria rosea]NVC23508.1 hypothetical protein [Kocuria salina]PAU91149.1 hypothetical protein CK505_07060 [Kocuria sp. WN036]
MTHLHRFAALLGVLTLTLAALRERLAADDPDRGDVPGWVMLTLMSAVLVAGLLLVAQPALEGLFQDAMARVSQN